VSVESSNFIRKCKSPPTRDDASSRARGNPVFMYIRDAYTRATALRNRITAPAKRTARVKPRDKLFRSGRREKSAETSCTNVVYDERAIDRVRISSNELVVTRARITYYGLMPARGDDVCNRVDSARGIVIDHRHRGNDSSMLSTNAPLRVRRNARRSSPRRDGDSIIRETAKGKEGGRRREINLGFLGARELRCALIRFSSRSEARSSGRSRKWRGTDGFITAISHFVRLLRQRTLFVSNVETWREFTGFNGAATQEREGGNSNNIRRGR